MDLKNWMADYKDKKLGEMVLPGSHDAGTIKNYIDLTKFGTNSNSATQNLTIRDQLRVGTRFFDLRLTIHDQQVVAHHTTGGQGAYSKVSVNEVLAQTARWCLRHPSEVVIFRISHTSSTTKVDEIVKVSTIHEGKSPLHKGTGNLCTKTLEEITLNGGLVCIFDEDEFKSIKQSEGIHGFTKYSKKAANNQGISCCGCYKGAHDLQQVIRNGLKGEYEHNDMHGFRHEHLWQVYWQKTYGNPLSSTGIEKGTIKETSIEGGKLHGGTHDATDYMIDLMEGHELQYGEDFEVQPEESHREGVRRKKVVTKPAVMYSTRLVRERLLPNIISYDFVNERINKKIIAMNTPLVMAHEYDADDES